MTYLQEMAKHEAWMANSRRASKEFAEDMRVMDAELAKVEAFVEWPTVREFRESAERGARREDDCSCDQDPLGVCPQHGPQSLTDAMYNATLSDCLAECAESNPVAPAVRYR